MELAPYIERLAINAKSIEQLIVGVDDAQAKWKPDADTWSIVEVMNHLYDTEYLDFKVRLDYILHKPNQDAPEIYPQQWVTERAYNHRDLASSVQNFLDERQKSLDWLGTLSSPNWDATMTRDWGTIRAGDMFSAWVAHDLLHLRQLVELHYAWTVKQVVPYQVNYAGDW
ncbi:MAG: DinB family protein [Chloroflexota bacterium]